MWLPVFEDQEYITYNECWWIWKFIETAKRWLWNTSGIFQGEKWVIICWIYVIITQMKWSCCLCNGLLTVFLERQGYNAPKQAEYLKSGLWDYCWSPPFRTPQDTGSGRAQRLICSWRIGKPVESRWHMVSLGHPLLLFCPIQNIYLLATQPTFLNRLWFFLFVCFGYNFTFLQTYKQEYYSEKLMFYFLIKE